MEKKARTLSELNNNAVQYGVGPFKGKIVAHDTLFNQTGIRKMGMSKNSRYHFFLA
jgi:hypothetical protein